MWLFKLSNLIAIVFKPVIFVAGISLMFIVVTSIQYGMWTVKRENNLNGVTLGMSGDNTSTLSIEGVSDIEVNQKDLFGKWVIEDGQNVFSYLLMLLLTLFLMRWFIKLSLTIGGWPIEGVMTKLTGRAEDIARTTPILPFAWGASIYGASEILGKNRDKMVQWFGMNKWWERGSMSADGRSFEKNEDKFNAFINSKVGLQDPRTSNNDLELERLAKNMDVEQNKKFFSRSQELAKEKEWWLSMANNTQWVNSLKLLLSSAKFAEINKTLADGKKFLSAWNPGDKAETYFTEQNVKALYYAMGWPAATPGKTEPRTYEELLNITFYPTKQ